MKLPIEESVVKLLPSASSLRSSYYLTSSFIKRMRLTCDGKNPIFSRSDAAATHRTILCGFYSRAATNREWRSLNSGFSVKSFVIVRALRKASFIRLTKNCNAVTWF